MTNIRWLTPFLGNRVLFMHLMTCGMGWAKTRRVKKKRAVVNIEGQHVITIIFCGRWHWSVIFKHVLKLLFSTVILRSLSCCPGTKGGLVMMDLALTGYSGWYWPLLHLLLLRCLSFKVPPPPGNPGFIPLCCHFLDCNSVEQQQFLDRWVHMHILTLLQHKVQFQVYCGITSIPQSAQGSWEEKGFQPWPETVAELLTLSLSNLPQNP